MVTNKMVQCMKPYILIRFVLRMCVIFFNWAYSRMMDHYPSPSYLHARCKF